MIYFLVPVFNEVDNLPKLAASFLPITRQHDIHFVFVDDCSTDGSVELIRDLFRDQRLQVITKEVNRGPGDSFNLGFEWILQFANDEDQVLTLEADGTSDLGIFPEMIALAKDFKYDLVLASVYAQGGGFEQTSLFRKLISFFANMLLRGLFDIKVLTLSSFYRVYRIGLLKKIKEHHNVIVEGNGFVCMFEVVLKSVQLNARIVEVPMRLRSIERIGKSKMRVWKTSKEYFKTVVKFKMS